MSTKEVDAPARSAPSAPSSVRRSLRGFADRWPFQRKLNVLVGIPLAVIALLLTYLIVDLVQEYNRAEDSAQLVRDSTQVAQLVSALQNEHQQAILLSVRYEASLDGGAPSTDAYRQSQSAVDAQVERVVDAFGDRLPDTEAQALRDIAGLSGLRSTVEQGYLAADSIDPAYSGAANGLIDGLGLDRNSTLATTFTGNLLDSLLRADAAHGAYETGVFSARTGDSNALIEFTGAVGSHALYIYQAQRFGRFATAAQAAMLGDIEHNPAQAAISRHFAELAVDPSALQAESAADIRRAFRTVIASYPDYSAQAGARLQITTSLIDQIADRADDASVSAQWRVGVLLSLTLIGFALWIAFSILVRRSVVRPVLALTGAAQEVADVAGRELARVADDDAEESGPPLLRELPVTANDEIGELAEAFNNVQTTAAALLERQVLSRRNVAEMFGNVGRRVSNLTTRQLALIDAVERGETDPALLERLYSIDHIAVRLRRNADSLMLLAGIRETVLDSGPTALTNVVRAALGQIEGFQRVQLRASTETMVEPDIIGDLTLMIAELLENAVAFSPEGSPVEVLVGTDPEGASITVADHGLGMSVERLAEENARLVRRERLDLVPTRVLGLFVVGALARRWDIDVTLSRTPGGGVTVEVLIPSTLLLTMSEVGPAGKPAPLAPPSSLASPAIAAASAPAAGPSASASVPSWAMSEDDPNSLPRRVPRRDPAPTDGKPETTLTPTADAATTDAATAHSATGHSATTDPATTGPGTSARAAATSVVLTAAGRPEAPTAATTTAAATDPDGPVPASASTSASAPAATAGPTARTHPSGPGIPAPRTAVPTLHTRAEDGPEPVPDAPTTAGRNGGAAGPAVRPGLPTRRSEPVATDGADRAAEPAPLDDGPRPLRRRVRGATLRTTADAAALQAARQAPRPADADAVRSALDEFEAAVARAHRDSSADTGEHPRLADGPTEGRTDSLSEGPIARRNDHRRDHRPYEHPDRADRTERTEQTERTEPSDSSSDRTDLINDPITDPITGRDATHQQNHLPEGAEQ